MRTIDLAGLEENTYQYDIQSTPRKEKRSPSIPYASPRNPFASPSIPYASPSIPYASPRNLFASSSIPYASPSSNRSLQTPTHERSTSGMIR